MTNREILLQPNKSCKYFYWIITGPQILIGSSIGGWLSLLVSMERSDRLHSLVTIANAADVLHHRYCLILLLVSV